MITVSVANSAIRTSELLAIEQVVNHLPIFASYDSDRIKTMSQTVFDLMKKTGSTRCSVWCAMRCPNG